MNWILACVFNLLLFNSCLTANIDRGSSSGGNQQQNRSRNGAQAEAFLGDFLAPVFDVVDFGQILQMAKKPESTDFVKKYVFPEKYANHKFGLQIQDGDIFSEVLSSVYIHDFDVYMDVITHFGNQIKSISVSDSGVLDEEQSAVLFGNISEQCSEILTSMSMGGIKEYTFSHFTKPFPNVTEMNFNVKSNQIGSFSTFNETFPSLEYLRMDYHPGNVPIIGNRLIESELPAMANLKSFVSYVGVNNPEDLAIIQNQLANMFQKNQQIQKFWYSRLDDFIQKVSENLPNLEHLSFHSLDLNIRPVHFESVKHLKVTLWGNPCPVERITFSNLDTLEMAHEKSMSQGSLHNSWMEFFKNHQNLKQLKCDAIEEDGIEEFLAELPNLHGIQISSFESFNLTTVTQLIEGPQNWVKFHYDANPRDRNVPMDMDGFLEKFQNAWNITYNFEGRQFIELERIN